MRIYKKMKLSETDIKEIQRLYLDGTPGRELAKCYGVDEKTIRYHCRPVTGEPVRRLEQAEIVYLIYVRHPASQYLNIDGLWQAVRDDKQTFPRLSRMTRMRFGQVVSQCLNRLGWERNAQNARCYTYYKSETSAPVTMEW